jgi:hypothetical protein
MLSFYQRGPPTRVVLLCLTLLESSGMMLCTNCDLIVRQIRRSGTFRGDVSLSLWLASRHLGAISSLFSYALGKLIARTGTKKGFPDFGTVHDNAIQP